MIKDIQQLSGGILEKFPWFRIVWEKVATKTI